MVKKRNCMFYLAMSVILTILSFPIPCMAIWQKNHLGADPLAFHEDHSIKPACEIALPTMWMALSEFHASIRFIATLTGPGPFTAVRAGLAFAQGLVHGDDQWSLFSTSLFALMPESMRPKMILDTGGDHWVDQHGVMMPIDGIPADDRLSSSTCSLADRLRWSRELAQMAGA